jgi:hypothetical protein
VHAALDELEAGRQFGKIAIAISEPPCQEVLSSAMAIGADRAAGNGIPAF